MTKVLFILSAVVILVATLFAYQNGRAFTDMRNKVQTVNNKLKGEMTAMTALKKQLDEKAEVVTTVQKDLEDQSAQLKSHKLKIAQADNDAKTAQDDLAKRNASLEELKLKLAKLPQGVKAETLVEDQNKIKAAIDALKVEAEQKKKEVETEESKVAEVRKGLDDLARKVEDRKKGFDRNSLSARVIAVNRDWGFVVIDAGQTRGVTQSSKLLVTRGAQTVGKLSIVTVQDGRTIANIIPETLAQGLEITPGDRVILENLYQ